ncbi:helix-turn-helix domain-containing protein [bacterium]|nr:helix-turn-helix domain-containing protein [bacterium]
MKINSNIIGALKDRINGLNLTYQQAGDKMGVRGQTVTRWLNGDIKTVSDQTMKAMAKFLKMEPERLEAMTYDFEDPAVWAEVLRVAAEKEELQRGVIKEKVAKYAADDNFIVWYRKQDQDVKKYIHTAARGAGFEPE